MNMEKRLGFVGIIVDDPALVAERVNALISEFGPRVVARMGIPYRERDCSVITLVVEATTDDLGQFTGRLGALDGVSVRSMLRK
jgi:putative iron-only hydrogenase system regulator